MGGSTPLCDAVDFLSLKRASVAAKALSCNPVAFAASFDGAKLGFRLIDDLPAGALKEAMALWRRVTHGIANPGTLGSIPRQGLQSTSRLHPEEKSGRCAYAGQESS